MKVYIAGKIGEEVISDATRRKFARAEEMLRAKGFKVENPASDKCQRLVRYSMMMEKSKYGYSGDFYSFALMTDIVSIWRDCDAVYFLDDWSRSPGATAEYYFAKAVGKRMFWQDRKDACEYLIQRMYDEAKAEGRTIEYDGLQERNDTEIAYFEKHLDEAWLPIAGKEGGV